MQTAQAVAAQAVAAIKTQQLLHVRKTKMINPKQTAGIRPHSLTSLTHEPHHVGLIDVRLLCNNF